eukprot:6284594-Amphidinium_carterae.1
MAWIFLFLRYDNDYGIPYAEMMGTSQIWNIRWMALREVPNIEGCSILAPTNLCVDLCHMLDFRVCEDPLRQFRLTFITD